jgi:hypothetical protein
VETLPGFIKNRGQAVTMEDYENLIMNQFGSLSRVKCFPTTDGFGNFRPGHILIVVLPTVEKAGGEKGSQTNREFHVMECAPYPQVDFLRNIKQYVNKMAIDTVISSGRLHISGPFYFRIFISANLHVEAMDDLPIAERKALSLINRLLDPIGGGKEGTGWEFRKILNISEIYELFSSIPEVKHVDKVSARYVLDQFGEANMKGKNINGLKKEFILSETSGGDDIETIMSALLPHSLLSDGTAHSLRMMLSEHP